MVLEMNLVVQCGESGKLGTNLERSLKYFNNKLIGENYKHVYDKDQRQKYHHNQWWYCKRKIQSFNEKKTTYGAVNNKPPASDTNESQAVNVCATIAVYYNGVWPQDICNTMPFLGVTGGYIFNNHVYDNMEKLYEKNE